MKRLGLNSAALFVFALAPMAFGQGGGMMGSGTTASFMGHEGREMNQNLVLPQIAVGQHYTTSVLLLNMTNAQQMPWANPQILKTTGKMYIYGQDGTRLSVSVNGGQPASEFAFSLDPSQSAHYEISFAGADTSGWALISVDDNPAGTNLGMMNGSAMNRGAKIMATAFYTYQDGSSGVTSRVGVIPSMYEMGLFKTSIISVLSQPDVYAGVAIVNTSGTTVNVQLNLRDTNGNLRATAPLTLKSGNQIAKFTAELFGNALPSGTPGFLEITTDDEGIVALGLLVSQGIMTSIPVMHHGPITMMP